MPAIKSTAEIAEKWSRVTPGRTRDYTDGIETPRRDWADATTAATENWEAGVQEAIAQDRFRFGVRNAGTRKWREKTLLKGPNRWAEGVRISAPDFREGFDPYRDEIERINLPPRYPRGDPRNLERVRIISERLHQLRLDLMRRGGG